MGTTRIYTKALKEEVVGRIKESGMPVAQISKEYGVNPKTVYGWLRNGVTQETSVLQMNRLVRENDELKRLIGELTLDLKKKR